MTEEEALSLMSTWLTRGDTLVNVLDKEGFHVLAHIVSDGITMVQHEALGLIVNDQPVDARSFS